MVHNRLNQGLRFWTATALVVGSMIGTGIFSLPITMASYGSLSIGGWLLSSLGTILIALVLVDLNKIFPETGGTFLYAYKAYGEFIGFFIATSYWFSWCIGCVGAIIPVSAFLAPYIPALNEKSIFYSPTLSLMIKVGLTWFMILINILGIRMVGRFQLITMLLKVLPLLLVCFIGFSHVKLTNFTDYLNISGKSNWYVLSSSMAFTFWAFTGLEAAVVPADGISSSKTIAQATLVGVVFTALIYMLVTFVLMGVYPAPVLKDKISPFNDLVMTFFGPGASLWVALGAIIAILGSINGGILILAQDAMAAARYKLLPRVFGETGSNNQTPVKGLIIAGVVMTLVLFLTFSASLLKQFNLLVLLSTLSMLIPYFISATAAMILLLNNPNKYSRTKLFRAFLVASLASIFTFLMLLGVGQEIIFYGTIFLFAIFWLHFFYKAYQLKTLAK